MFFLYRMTLEQSIFDSACVKTRNDSLIMNQAKANIPRSDFRWTTSSFTWDQITAANAKELQAKDPGVYQETKNSYQD